MNDTPTPPKPVHFIHNCHCGKWGAFGVGMAGGAEGRWYCGEHRPGAETLAPVSRPS